MSLDSEAKAGPSLSEDEQEARSNRYVYGLRLQLLSSGRWAIYKDLIAETEMRIRESLDENELRLMAEAQRELWERERELVSGKIVNMTVEDLGL